jgi:hypothetical protein
MSRIRAPAMIELSILALPGIHAMAAEADAAAKEEAEKAAQAFQSLYGDELKRVAETRDVADDLALAAKLLEAAHVADLRPALVTVLCEKCFDLAAQDPKGYDTAVVALPETLDAERFIRDALKLREWTFRPTASDPDLARHLNEGQLAAYRKSLITGISVISGGPRRRPCLRMARACRPVTDIDLCPIPRGPYNAGRRLALLYI